MPVENHSSFRDNDPVRRRKPEFLRRPGGLRKSIARLACSVPRQSMTAGLLGVTVFLLCHCHRQPAPPVTTPTPAPTVTPTASPPAAVIPAVTPSPTAVPTVSSSPVPPPTPTATPDVFEEGIIQLLQSSEKGFLEFRGKFKRTENGSGPDPLFRVRKIYEGTFLFAGASSAEIEEVYFGTSRQPAYNYHLYFQALSTRESIERYADLRLNLNRVLQGFEHTFGDRYDAWARDDSLKTAILLSSQDLAGSPEIQVHVALSSSQW
jgi:hypothetical protein